MSGRQECPACLRHFDAPGPCRNWVDGEECGFIEAPRPTERPAARRPTVDRPSMPSDGYAATGPPADPRDHLARARADLAAIRARKEKAA